MKFLHAHGRRATKSMRITRQKNSSSSRKNLASPAALMTSLQEAPAKTMRRLQSKCSTERDASRYARQSVSTQAPCSISPERRTPFLTDTRWRSMQSILERQSKSSKKSGRFPTRHNFFEETDDAYDTKTKKHSR